MNGGYSNGNGAVMPDLQHRMSKKIAQLTKVIYHLNNKNEDHDFDLQDMAGQYESEIEQILRDAATKVNTFVQQVEDFRLRTEDSKAVESLKILQSEYETSRRDAMSEFESYKSRVLAREGEMERAADAQLAAMHSEMAEVKAEFQSRYKEFQEALKAASKRGGDTEAMKKQVADLEAKKDLEIEELVKKYNKKYNEMLAERMTIEDDLREKVAGLLAQIEGIQGGGERAKVLQDEVAELRERLEAEQKAAAEEKAYLTDVQKNSDRSWKDKMERMIESQEADKALKAEQAAALEELRRKLAEAEGGASGTAEQLAAAQEALAAARAEAAAHAAALEQAAADAEGAGGELAALQAALDAARSGEADARKSLMGLDAAKDAALRDAAAAKASEEALAKELDALRNQLMAKEGEAGSELARAQAEAAALRKEAAANKEALEKSRAEAIILEAKFTKAEREAAEAAKEITKLKNELKDAADDAKRKIDAEKKAAMAALQAANKETAEAKKRITSLEADLKRAIAGADSDAANARAAALKEAEKKLTAARQDHLKALAEAEKDFKLREDAKSKDFAKKLSEREEKLRIEMAEMKKSLDEEHSQAVQTLDKRHAKKAEGWQTTNNELKVQIAELLSKVGEEQRRTQAKEGEKAQLIAQWEERSRAAESSRMSLEGKINALVASETAAKTLAKDAKDEAARCRQESSSAVATANQLRADVADLRRELESQTKKADKRLATELEKCNSDWARRAEEKCKDAMREKEEQHVVIIRQMTDRMASEKEAEKAALMSALGAKAEGREKELLKTIQERDAAADALRRKHAGELDAAASQKEAEKAELAKEAAGREAAALEERAASEAAIRSQHAEEVARAVAERADAEGAAAARHAEAMHACMEEAAGKFEAARAEAEAALEASVGEWTAKYEGETARLQRAWDDDVAGKTAQLLAEHASEKENLTGQHNAQVTNLEGEVRGLKEIRAELEEDKASLEALRDKLSGELAESRAEFAAKCDELVETVRGLHVRYADEKSELKSQHKEATEAMLAEHIEETRSLSEEFAAAQQEMEEKLAELQARFDDLQARHDARESREDDLATIAELQHACQQRDAFIEEQDVALKNIKAEMRNREESYNDRFGNTMNVQMNTGGVMDWMKPKNKGGSSKTAPKGPQVGGASFAGAVNKTMSMR